MLTDMQLRKVKPGDKPYKLPDGGGLHLYVTTAGGKLWRYRYEIHGKEKLLSLGSYPGMSLAEARTARDSAKLNLRSGRDPGIVKRQAKVRAKTEGDETFELLAREWHHMQSPTWAATHANDVMITLERDVFPRIGAMPIRQIAAPDVLSLDPRA